MNRWLLMAVIAGLSAWSLACGRIGFELATVTDAGAMDGSADAGEIALPANCPALAAASGNTIEVSPAQAGDLPAIVAGAAAGTTIVFADGTYNLTETLDFSASDLTLRSLSGDASKVVLDASFGSAAIIVRGDDATIAEMTITRVKDDGIHIIADRTLVYGVSFLDIDGAAIRANPAITFPDDVEIRCSLFTQSPDMISSGCEVVGVSARGVRGWKVVDNRFDRFHCNGSRLDRTMQFSGRSRDIFIARNIIRDSFIGFQLGLNETADVDDRSYADEPACAQSAFFDFLGGTICNNVLYRTSAVLPVVDTGIAVWQGCDVLIAHNTVATATGTDSQSAIEWRYSNTTLVEVVSNLVTGTLRARSAVANEHDNLTITNPEDAFVDLASTNLHLVSGHPAIDGAVAVPRCANDIDLQTRDAMPDFGADEF